MLGIAKFSVMIILQSDLPLLYQTCPNRQTQPGARYIIMTKNATKKIYTDAECLGDPSIPPPISAYNLDDELFHGSEARNREANA